MGSMYAVCEVGMVYMWCEVCGVCGGHNVCGVWCIWVKCMVYIYGVHAVVIICMCAWGMCEVGMIHVWCIWVNCVVCLRWAGHIYGVWCLSCVYRVCGMHEVCVVCM